MEETMGNDVNIKKECKVKNFFSRLFKNLDKKIEEKAKNSKSCCGTDKPGNKSCCS